MTDPKRLTPDELAEQIASIESGGSLFVDGIQDHILALEAEIGAGHRRYERSTKYMSGRVARLQSATTELCAENERLRSMWRLIGKEEPTP